MRSSVSLALRTDASCCVDLGFCCGDVGFCLVDRMEIVLMVDFDEQLVGLHEVALIDIQFGNIAVDSGEDVDHLIGCDVGRVRQADVQVPLEAA